MRDIVPTDNFNEMIQELAPIVTEYLLITIEERKNPVCHDSIPVVNAINIVVYHTMLSLPMMVHLKMKYAEITDNNLTEDDRILGDIDYYNREKSRSLRDLFQISLDVVYRTGHYLMQNGPDTKEIYQKYIKPIQLILDNPTIKSADKT